MITTTFKFNYKKATQALNVLALKEGGAINKMKALKLIYFADRYHLRKYGRLITNDNYIAMENGPVASRTRDIAEKTNFIGRDEKSYANTYLESKGKYDLKSKLSPDTDVFSDSDIEALEFAWEKFGHFDKFKLASITHDYPEWSKHRDELNRTLSMPMDLDDFFDDPNTAVDECFALSEEDKRVRREHLKELIHLESIWG